MSNINITLVDSIGLKKRIADIPSDIAVGKITAALVSKMGLPATGVDGLPLSYHLNLMGDKNHELDESNTLEESGIKEGDNLQMKVDSAEPKRVPRIFKTFPELRDNVTGLKESQFEQSVDSRPFRCFKTGGHCPQNIKVEKNFVFVAMPFTAEFKNVYKEVIQPTISKLGYTCRTADEVPANIDLMCKICDIIQQSALNIVDITGWNPNVLFELGMMYGMGKRAILLKHEDDDVPVDLRGMEYIPYQNFKKLRTDLERFLTEGGDPAQAFLDKACALCHINFEHGDEIAICVTCQVAHHKKCWQENKTCIICKSVSYIS